MLYAGADEIIIENWSGRTLGADLIRLCLCCAVCLALVTTYMNPFSGLFGLFVDAALIFQLDPHHRRAVFLPRRR